VGRCQIIQIVGIHGSSRQISGSLPDIVRGKLILYETWQFKNGQKSRLIALDVKT
jgi:hypothetical protein